MTFISRLKSAARMLPKGEIKKKSRSVIPAIKREQ
jgi:hypothetical protein